MSRITWIVIIILIALGIFFVSNQEGTNVAVESSIKDSMGVEMTTLVAVDGSQSTGTAYILRENGTLQHLVEADMPDPAVGSSYEGWLVDTSTTPLRFFSTGVMSENSDGVWILEYNADEEYPTYNKVVITEETIIDQTPEKHIIEGDF